MSTTENNFSEVILKNRTRKCTAAIILAAGGGTRMKCDTTKQNIEIFGETVLERSVRAFDECEAIDYIIAVVRKEDVCSTEKRLSRFKKLTSVISGGSTRRESAENGFNAIPDTSELVAIHDAARCLVTPKMIENIVLRASDYGAATAVSPIFDTVKLSEDGFIKKTIPREKLYAAGTPQIFLVDLYKKALKASKEDSEITDDNMMVEKLGEKIFCVDVGRENLKITKCEDLDIAEFIIEKRMKNG